MINPKISCYFQISLFNKLNSKYKESNLIISPLSIYQAISLATNGAKGETQKELLKLLDEKEMEEINLINRDILNKIKDFKSLEIANAIMTKFTPNKKFITSGQKYGASIQTLKSASQVNSWCNA